jgi:hypothetical protein
LNTSGNSSLNNSASSLGANPMSFADNDPFACLQQGNASNQTAQSANTALPTFSQPNAPASNMNAAPTMNASVGLFAYPTGPTQQGYGMNFSSSRTSGNATSSTNKPASQSSDPFDLLS